MTDKEPTIPFYDQPRFKELIQALFNAIKNGPVLPSQRNE